MQERFYTDDRNTLILLALLKKHGIRYVVASPGTTNIALVASMQYDRWFIVYSSVDERSAAYMACGIAESSNEPVVLSCTGATASRNYFPALTEAYYRKLPIIAITGSHGDDIRGHLYAQSLDRSQAPKDTVIFSSVIKKRDTEWKVTTEINKAIIALKRHGGGPVHLDLESAAYGSFTTKELPKVRKIDYYTYEDAFPDLKGYKVAIFVGSHKRMDDDLTNAINIFCERYNSVVFTDITSGYHGKYKTQYALVASQECYREDICDVDVLIHLGEVSGDMYTTSSLKPKETWRVSQDGEVKDLFSRLTKVFDMTETYFFLKYAEMAPLATHTEYRDTCAAIYQKALGLVPELPFGNIWIAKELYTALPKNTVLYCGILNTLRSWNFFEVEPSIDTRCNVGGFGIDGTISTLLGSSLTNPNRIHIGILGDLAFFYDINALGNRHLGGNVRLLLINNGRGTEFRNYDHPGAKWGAKADDYIAAAGHFGVKSPGLVKHYCQDLGFHYICASNKGDFNNMIGDFLNENNNIPILFEVFTDSKDESKSLNIVRSVLGDNRAIGDKIVSYGKSIVKKLTKK